MTDVKRSSPSPVVQRLAERPLFFALAIGYALVSVWWLKNPGPAAGDWPERTTMILLMLLNACGANLFPKMILRTESDRITRRVTGWAIVLGCLISAAVWTFAPVTLALWATVAFFGGAMIFTGGCVLLMPIERASVADNIAVWALVIATLVSGALWVYAPMYQALSLTIAIFGGMAASVYFYFRAKRSLQTRPAEPSPHSSVD